MSRMHRLFGVTMVEKGVSRLVSVDLGGAEELLAASDVAEAPPIGAAGCGRVQPPTGSDRAFCR
jgi:hypothetical protein